MDSQMTTSVRSIAPLKQSWTCLMRRVLAGVSTKRICRIQGSKGTMSIRRLEPMITSESTSERLILNRDIVIDLVTDLKETVLSSATNP